MRKEKLSTNKTCKTSQDDISFHVKVNRFQHNYYLPLLSLQREMCASHLRGVGLVLDALMNGIGQGGSVGDHWPHS